ncbi:MAG: type IV pilus assembly protein PilM [Parcubacteria group bacterium]|nr:type IV pilus assembly protein PilM [Parcubacteria group bacterium]
MKIELPFGSFNLPSLPKFPSFSLPPLRVLPNAALGIDIGTSSLKVVELSRWGERRNLKNYGELRIPTLYKKPFRTFEKSTLLLETRDIARALKAILQEANIKSRRAVFSLPDFSSFFTNFQLPPMSKEEIPDAVTYEARRHIPVPLSEVIFDWEIVDHATQSKDPLDVLLVAVPNEVVNQYQEIARMCELDLVALEAEVFGLIRSWSRDERTPTILLDIGAQSTTVNVVSEGMLRSSHSFDIAGNTLTERLAKAFSTDYETAEREKATKGIAAPETITVLSPLVDLIIKEIEAQALAFKDSKGKDIQKIILGGGAALLPGLKDYVAKSTGKTVEIINPFHTIFYSPVLEYTLQPLGPSYAVAVGMALRALE